MPHGYDDADEVEQLRLNANNLAESLHALLKRIDQLENNRRIDVENSGSGTDHVHVETIDDGATKITKRTQVTERVTTTKTYQSSTSPIDGTDIGTTTTTSSLLPQNGTTANYDASAPNKTRIGEQSSMMIIGMRHKNGEHLLATAYQARLVRLDHCCGNILLQGIQLDVINAQLIVKSVDPASALAKQGLVQPGDTLLEINGHEIHSIDEFERFLADKSTSADAITLKVVSSRLHDAPVFYRTLYDYEPFGDDKIPCKSIGLAYRSGEVIQVISKEDANWWQARKVNDLSRVGLVPSDALQQSRQGKKDKPFYEQVGILSPYGRRVLVLLGAPGVGRRTLKSMLLAHDRNNFATVTPHTTRTKRAGEQEGREYHFIDGATFKKNIQQGGLIEWGEFGGNLYGTSVDSVRTIIRSGRMCVLDCSPQAVQQLYNREFMPYIVLLVPPSFDELKQIHQVYPHRGKNRSDEDMKRTCEESELLESQHRQLFDLVLVNRSVDVTFRRLIDALDALKGEPQWVPIAWLL